jgi:parallel beta-helix repeat protein
MNRYTVRKRYLTVVIILIFIGSCVLPITAQKIEEPSFPTSRGNWLYVGGSGPGNYSRIQDAIDNSTIGDIVFVYSGTYYENITIQHPISLIGENKDITIIVGNETERVVNVTADYVNITGFTIQDGYEGILIEARYAKISDNRIINNAYGIGLKFPYMKEENIPNNPFAFISWNRTHSYQNDYHIVVNNTISNNEIGIIIFHYSWNNTVASNVFLQSRLGVAIFGSCNNSLMNNTFVNSGLYVSNDTYSNNIVNNTVNGKPLLHLEGQSNQVIQDDIGQLILLRCHNITVSGQEITNTSYGIQLADTNHCHISQNIIMSNACSGIDLRNSCYNTIVNNTISANAEDGIQFQSNNNTIIGNTITFNTNNGLTLFSSDYNTIANNNISNNRRGINIGYSDDYNLISGNIIQSNEECGITMSDSRNNTLLQNDITSNTEEGIDISDSEHIIIQNNTISDHYNGIKLSISNHNYLMGNTITENAWNGIDLNYVCDFNVISGKNSLSNNTCGIHMYASDSNTISTNNLINNTQNGIECHSSDNNIITKNNICWNQPTSNYETGIEVSHSTNTTITDNTIINASHGLELDYESNDNIILRNNIHRSLYVAIRCFASSSNNQIRDNSLVENALGIAIQSSNDTLIMNNDITHNTGTGIDIYYSSHTIISKNCISKNSDGIILNYSALDTILNENAIEENLRAGIAIQFTAVHNTISDNMVCKNNLGINISGKLNSIHHNMIVNNALGLYIWRCDGNTICCNNFLSNQKNAGFKVYPQERYNKWNKNYWDQPRVFPILIPGKILWSYRIDIPWLNVDWNPAQQPYDV